MPQDFGTTPSDPRRWVRRSRYQEGPGFLFIATQNGRPAAEPPRPSLVEVRRRMRALRLADLSGVESALSAPRLLGGFPLPLAGRLQGGWNRRFGSRIQAPPSAASHHPEMGRDGHPHCPPSHVLELEADCR